jgi:hypothetical protein
LEREGFMLALNCQDFLQEQDSKSVSEKYEGPGEIYFARFRVRGKLIRRRRNVSPRFVAQRRVSAWEIPQRKPVCASFSLMLDGP